MPRISFFNIANAKRDEKSVDYCLGKREPAVWNLVHDMDPDILCLSELRRFRIKRGEIQEPAAFIQELGVPSHDQEYRNNLNRFTVATLRPMDLEENSFWRATIYNEKRIRHLVSTHQYAIKPNNELRSGVTILFSLFERTPRNNLWVINVHMPMGTKDKLQVVSWLNNNAVDICRKVEDEYNGTAKMNYDTPIILGGDFNTFMDIPEDGSEMLKQLSENWNLLSDSSIPTFKSLPHDTPCRISVLDRIFEYKNHHVSPLKDVKYTASPVDGFKLETLRPSDHALVSIDFS